MKKNSKKTKNGRSVLFFLTIIILVVLGAITYISMQNDRSGRDDQQRFSDIADKESRIASALENYLGDEISNSEQSNQCFNTGQGPFDNGYLWCQATSLFVLKPDYDVHPEELGDVFLKAGGLYGNGESVSGYSLPLYVTKLNNGASCYLGIRLVSGVEVSGARKNPFVGHKDGANPLVAITCGDRAQAKHYTYVD